MSRLSAIVATIVAACSLVTAQEKVAFRFTGSLFAEEEVVVFGHTLDPADLVTGHVVYRTGVECTVPLGNCENCAGYPVDLVSGFSMTVGGLELRYDSYAVAVYNDVPGFDPEFPEDSLRFGRNQDGPATYERRLIVNGVPHPIGFMDLSLWGVPSTFTSVGLPNDPQPNDFFVGYLMIDDGTGIPAEETEQRFTGFVGGIIDAFTMERFAVDAGDYFLDSEISWEDYNVWRSDIGLASSSSADGNRDGIVDAADYTIWRDALESPPLVVPEPSSIGYVLFALVMAAAPRNVTDAR
jgi:hypothetical protein